MSGAVEPQATLPLVPERAWLRAVEDILPAHPRGGHSRLSLGHPPVSRLGRVSVFVFCRGKVTSLLEGTVF